MAINLRRIVVPEFFSAKLYFCIEAVECFPRSSGGRIVKQSGRNYSAKIPPNPTEIGLISHTHYRSILGLSR